MASKEAGRPRLPVITVARMQEATELVDRLVSEKTDIFLRHASDYRAKHRAHNERALSPFEAGQLVGAMAAAVGEGLPENPAEAIRGIQESSLRAQDDPDFRELMLSAGLATAPALIDACLRLVALVEMDGERFEQSCEDGRIDESITEDLRELKKLPLVEARMRATAALAHVQEATGATKGEAWGLLVRLIVQAFSQAMQMTRPAPSPSESPTSSLVDTTGPDETSSTAPPSEQP